MYRDEIIDGNEKLTINIYKKNDLEKPFVIPEGLDIKDLMYKNDKLENEIVNISYSR
ncbi:hypothetical protein [Lactococcus cremoris]|uniref:hypothetical protein n=1 Tax=Lactococcus lactis subsp. cremoris TaxID=1359 RepID=UPI002FC6B0E3